MISSEKNKDLWIEDYIKRVKVLSAQEIKLLETSWSSENNKVENYFRTDDGQGKLNLWLIDTYNYENLTVEMQVNLNVPGTLRFYTAVCFPSLSYLRYRRSYDIYVSSHILYLIYYTISRIFIYYSILNI